MVKRGPVTSRSRGGEYRVHQPKRLGSLSPAISPGPMYDLGVYYV